MSQAGSNNGSGGGGGSGANTFITDVNGPATTSAGVIQILGAATIENNNNGIQTEGPVGPGNIVFVELTNRLFGVGTTVGNGDSDLLIMTLGTTPGVFTYDIRASAFAPTADSGAGEGVGFEVFGTARTTGAAAFIVGTPDKIQNFDLLPDDLSDSDFNLVASGNTIIFRATGSAAANMNWTFVAYYTFVS